MIVTKYCSPKSTKKLALAGVLCAVAIVGSMFSFPVFGSKCAPVQHLGLGSLLAFPGSMCGALLCGLAWKKSKNLWLTLAAEVFGTGIIGGLLSYPIAVAFMGVDAGTVAFYAYVVPFLVSTVGGSILAGALVFALQRSGALGTMRGALEH